MCLCARRSDRHSWATRACLPPNMLTHITAHDWIQIQWLFSWAGVFRWSWLGTGALGQSLGTSTLNHTPQSCLGGLDYITVAVVNVTAPQRLHMKYMLWFCGLVGWPSLYIPSWICLCWSGYVQNTSPCRHSCSAVFKENILDPSVWQSLSDCSGPFPSKSNTPETSGTNGCQRSSGFCPVWPWVG